MDTNRVHTTGNNSAERRLEPIGPQRGLFEIVVVLATFFAVAFGIIHITGLFPLAPLATAVALAPAYFFARRRGESPIDFGLGTPRYWSRTLVIGTALLPIIIITLSILQPALETAYGSADLSKLGAIEGNTPLFVYYLAVSWILAGFGEEALYRGFILTRMSQILGLNVPAWGAAVGLQAALFGFCHFYQGPAGMISTGVIGLLLGLGFVIVKRNLWGGVLAHGLLDTLGFTDLYMGGNLF